MENIQQPTPAATMREHGGSNIQRPSQMRLPLHWLLEVGRWGVEVPRAVLIFAIRFYRWTVSPVLGFLSGPTGGCRFTPSCSEYAMDTIRSQGVLAGGWLAVKRVCRCHPWGGCGHDPAPETERRTPKAKFRF